MSGLTEDYKPEGRCISCKHWTHKGNIKFWNDWADCSQIQDTGETPQQPGKAYVDGQGMVHGSLVTHSRFGCVLFERVE